MQNENRSLQKVQNTQHRYSIFHNPLFQKNQGPLFQNIPFHISLEQKNDYQYVIDHTNNHIQRRQSMHKADEKKSERSNSQRKKIFSEKKKDQTRQFSALSPIQIIKGREYYSFERELRKHKIFGDYAKINSNQGRSSYKPDLKNTHYITNHMNVPPFVLIKQQSEPAQNTAKVNKSTNLIVNKKPSIGDQPMKPIQFTKLMFDTRLSQRLRQQKNRQKQETRILRITSCQDQVQPQIFLR